MQTQSACQNRELLQKCAADELSCRSDIRTVTLRSHSLLRYWRGFLSRRGPERYEEQQRGCQCHTGRHEEQLAEFNSIRGFENITELRPGKISDERSQSKN